MTFRALLRRFGRDTGGAGAAEFALLLPLSVLFVVGLLDAGRLFYDINRGEKATQVGARWAVVTNPISPQLTSTNYVGQVVGGVTLSQGDRVPAGALGLLTCNSASCTCTTAPCPASLTRNAAPFDALLARMQQIMPQIEAANLIVEYRGSGLGYAGDPNGMDISPLVTVRIAGLNYSPFLLFGGDVALPDFSYTLTMEDGTGTGSN
jgi:Flp pilus assembly pilin Flp